MHKTETSGKPIWISTIYGRLSSFRLSGSRNTFKTPDNHLIYGLHPNCLLWLYPWRLWWNQTMNNHNLYSKKETRMEKTLGKIAQYHVLINYGAKTIKFIATKFECLNFEPAPHWQRLEKKLWKPKSDFKRYSKTWFFMKHQTSNYH